MPEKTWGHVIKTTHFRRFYTHNIIVIIRNFHYIILFFISIVLSSSKFANEEFLRWDFSIRILFIILEFSFEKYRLILL